MRRIGLIACVTVLAGALFAPSAQATDLNNLPTLEMLYAKFNDWSSLYDISQSQLGDSLGSGTFPTGGEEGRAIGYVTNILDEFAVELWNPVTSDSELTISEFDFVIPTAQGYYFDPVSGGYLPFAAPGGIQGTDLYFIPGSEFGGLIDIWEDTSKDWASELPPTEGPDAWVVDTDHLDYPGVSDIDIDGNADAGVSLWMRGTYVPLFWDMLGPNNQPNSIRDPGEPDLVIFDINGDGLGGADDVSAVYLIGSYNPAGVGDITAYIDVFGGSAAWRVDGDIWDQSGSPYDYDIFLAGEFQSGAQDWGVRSFDPAQFRLVPEPATMSLFGLGLVGLIGYVRRKRKK